MALAAKHTDKLQDLKKNVESSAQYFKDNIIRYHKFMEFVFNTSLSETDKNVLTTLGKPAIEFNILEAMISRLRGEFAKQEPSIVARAADGIRIQDLTQDFLETLEVVASHLREIFFNATNDSLEYNLYSDLLAGGFSVVNIFTDYVNEMSFEQVIKVERAFDPTMTGFDPLARESHKGDGQYCFELIPMTREDFELEFGADAAKDIKFERAADIKGFNWSYKNQDKEIVLVANYFYKEKKKEILAKLSNGHSILAKHYPDAVEEWDRQQIMDMPPIIIEQRPTIVETICRYKFCENKVLSHDKTNFRYLPLIFIDGNSVNLRDGIDGATHQMCRPFIYHAKGIQQLKNISGQTIAYEIENMMQHKIMIPVEGIPDDYIDAYKNVARASTLAYNSFFDGNVNVPLLPPREIMRTPTPPIVENTFMGTDQVTQTILGTYDSILGTNDKQISGVAIQQGAMQSNAAAIPYLMGYIKGLNRIAQVVIDLIPKYYVTPRSLPIMKADGKRSFQIINDKKNKDSISMQYNPNSLQIKVEAGVSSSVQKQVALEQIIKLMGASERFAAFINTMGLETILDNMDIRGIEQLKAQAVIFMKEEKEAQAANSEKEDPMVEITKEQNETLKQIEFARIEQQAIKADGDHAVATAKVALEKEKNDLKFMEIVAKIENESKKVEIDQEKVDSENARSAVEMAMNITKEHREQERIGDEQ